MVEHNVEHMRKLASDAPLMCLDQYKFKIEVDVVVSRLMESPNTEYAKPDHLLKPIEPPTHLRFNVLLHHTR